MRVLIIGGTRLTGPLIVEHLLSRGHEVTVYHTGAHERQFSKVVYHIHGDRRDHARFKEQVAAIEVDAVIDMTAMNGSDAEAVVDAFRGRVRRALAISSGDVYAVYSAIQTNTPMVQPLPIREDAPLRSQLYPYGQETNYEKILVEEAFQLANRAGDFPSTIIRYPALYGPQDTMCREWYWVKRVLDGRKQIALPGTGLQIFHRGFARNVAHGVVLALESDQAIGQVYNLGDTQILTVRTITDLIAQILGHEWEIVPVPNSLLSFRNPYAAEPHILYDLAKARAELGYSDLVGPEQAMTETVMWLRSNPPEGPIQTIPAESFDYEAEDRAISKVKRLVG